MKHCSRRDFLKIGGGVLAGCLLPTAGWSNLLPDSSRRTISFFNTHTGERLSVCYFKSGMYCQDAMARVNHILRDHRTGEVQPIDKRLLDILFSANQKLGCASPFHIISGYRSPKTNAMLRTKSRGVAKLSYHMLGKAVDIRLPDCATRKLRNACIDLELGGVGYYPRSNFVHVDTGAFRTWMG